MFDFVAVVFDKLHLGAVGPSFFERLAVELGVESAEHVREENTHFGPRLESIWYQKSVKPSPSVSKAPPDPDPLPDPDPDPEPLVEKSGASPTVSGRAA